MIAFSLNIERSTQTDCIFWTEVVIPLAGMATGVILGFPIIRAVVRRIDRGTGSDRLGDGQALRAEIEHLRSQLEALEERAEFTERLLAQERDRRQVGPGG